MKSVLKKFEKSSIDMSKIYGGQLYDTGRASATISGVTYQGTEYASISEGCVTTFVKCDNGLIQEGPTAC